LLKQAAPEDKERPQAQQSGAVLPLINLGREEQSFKVDSLAPVKALGVLPAAPAAAPPALADRVDRPQFNTETSDSISDNPFIRVAQDPLATFSIDVDTA